jgi:hypothetical protein
VVDTSNVDQEVKAELVPAGLARGLNLFQRYRESNLIPEFGLR